MIEQHHLPELQAWLKTCAECPPEQATVNLAVFADWLEERQDDRCGRIREILRRGPVEVEPVYSGPRSGRVIRFWSYDDEDQRVCPECGRIVATLIQHNAFNCLGCQTPFFISFTTSAEATREFLHRMRVECLAWFWIDPGCGLPNIDSRWPEFRVHLNDGQIVVVNPSGSYVAREVWFMSTVSDPESWEIAQTLLTHPPPERVVSR